MQVLSSVDSALVPAGATSEESVESKEKDIGLYISFKFIITMHDHAYNFVPIQMPYIVWCGLK